MRSHDDSPREKFPERSLPQSSTRFRLTVMKKLLIATLCLPILSIISASAQSHGNGGYYHTQPSYTPIYTPQPSYTPPRASAPRPQPAAPAPRTNAVPPNAARSEPTPSQIARERARAAETPRLREVRQEAMDALERIAAESRRMNGQGYDCILEQTGGMNCYRQPNINAPVSFNGQEVIRNPGVYAGAGEGRNNPALQNVRNTGPIPQGMWNVNHVAQTLQGHPHSNVLHLQPAPGTQTHDRDRFRMHGDYRTTDPRHGNASAGCPIVPPDTRSALANMLRQGGEMRLEVRPGAASATQQTVPAIP
jgi:hypothetical protein